MTTSARNWASLIDTEEIGLDDRYSAALCNLAAIQASEGEAGKTEAPDIGDPDEVITQVTSGTPPAWWPTRLERLDILIRARPEGSTPENFGPHPLDPNTTSGDLGLGTFTGMLKGMLEMAGTPFHGSIQIKIRRRQDKSTLGGWKGDIYVGDKEPKEKGRKGRRSDDEDEHYQYMLEKLEKTDEAMMRMFTNSSNVIHASASAINAMRGANVAPPWPRTPDRCRCG